MATNIYRVYVSVVVRIHMAIWEEAIGEERQENKLRQCEQFIPRQCEACSSALLLATGSSPFLASSLSPAFFASVLAVCSAAGASLGFDADEGSGMAVLGIHASSILPTSGMSVAEARNCGL